MHAADGHARWRNVAAVTCTGGANLQQSALGGDFLDGRGARALVDEAIHDVVHDVGVQRPLYWRRAALIIRNGRRAQQGHDVQHARHRPRSRVGLRRRLPAPPLAGALRVRMQLCFFRQSVWVLCQPTPTSACKPWAVAQAWACRRKSAATERSPLMHSSCPDLLQTTLEPSAQARGLCEAHGGAHLREEALPLLGQHAGDQLGGGVADGRARVHQQPVHLPHLRRQ